MTSEELRKLPLPAGLSAVAKAYIDELILKEDLWLRRADRAPWWLKPDRRIPKMYGVRCLEASMAAMSAHYVIRHAAPEARLAKSIRWLQQCERKAEVVHQKLRANMAAGTNAVQHDGAADRGRHS